MSTCCQSRPTTQTAARAPLQATARRCSRLPVPTGSYCWFPVGALRRVHVRECHVARPILTTSDHQGQGSAKTGLCRRKWQGGVGRVGWDGVGVGVVGAWVPQQVTYWWQTKAPLAYKSVRMFPLWIDTMKLMFSKYWLKARRTLRKILKIEANKLRMLYSYKFILVIGWTRSNNVIVMTSWDVKIWQTLV